MKKLILLVVITMVATLGFSAQAREWDEEDKSSTCHTPHPMEIFRAVLIASKATGLPSEYLFALLQTETQFGRNTGQPGRGISDAHPTRDGILFLELSSVYDFVPMRACASPRARSSSFGGAMGLSQFIPSTWGGLAGLFRKEFERENGEQQSEFQGLRFKTPTVRFGMHNEVRMLQRILNTYNLGIEKPLDEDGIFGPQTRKALQAFQTQHVLEWVRAHGADETGGACAREFRNAWFGGCTKVYLLWEFGKKKEVIYDPEKDRITSALSSIEETLKEFGYTIETPPHPWDPVASITATALYLCDEYKKHGNITDALGSYHVGNIKRNPRVGTAYANKVMGSTHLFKGVQNLMGTREGRFRGCKGF